MKKAVLGIIIVIAAVLSAFAYFHILSGIQIFCVAMVLIPLTAFLALRAVGKKEISAMRNGVPATATVINCETGNFLLKTGEVDKSYILKMDVAITNETGETWQAKIVDHVPALQAELFQPGFRFQVVYNPNNRNKVKPVRNVINGAIATEV